MSFKITLDMKSIGEPKSLRQAVELLPPKIKQAFYATAKKHGVLRRGTWNGCVFNVAGSDQGVLIRDTSAAMKVFGASEYVVTNFIRKWDATRLDFSYGSDEYATIRLIKILEAVGLNTPPAQGRVEFYEDAAGLEDFLLSVELDDLVKSIEVLSGVGSQ